MVQHNTQQELAMGSILIFCECTLVNVPWSYQMHFQVLSGQIFCTVCMYVRRNRKEQNEEYLLTRRMY